VVSWALSRTLSGWARIVFLLAASYAFYARWDWRYLPLIFGSSTVDYFLARVIARAQGPAKKRLLVITIVVNLALLAVFKYWNFVFDSVDALLALGGGAPLGARITITLPPVGISFFTFVSMSYVIDVYRGTIEPHDGYLRYLLFVAFFPHLVAGPIVRGRDLLPQLARPPVLGAAESGEGLFLIAVGLLKKVAIADQLAVNLVDRVFASPENYSAVETLAGIYAYAVQIYCDFSGYTDVAIGSALLLGVRFPDNFDAPYTAASLSEFWRRWHISLSSWLRDYLYVPLGGNRHGNGRTYLNLMLTMLLGGLWHGAAWTFVFWGFLHGLGLAVSRLFSRDDAAPARGALRALGVFFTFHWVCLAWVFFRAPDFGRAWMVLERVASFSWQIDNLPPLLAALLAVGLATHFMPRASYTRLREGFSALPAPAQGAALFVVAVALHEAASAQTVPFIYFQF
jgi:D-alanyl-lipoteichoic acid acyltransferase DltB (MBOAT superfamily)